jgi:signal transduction histidine kinase
MHQTDSGEGSASQSSRWLDRISITTKLAAMAIAFVVIVVALSGATAFSLYITDSIRGHVWGEGLWSKSQKDAVHHLNRYAHSGDPADYDRYRASLQTVLGHRKARLEMEKPEYDAEAVAEGFTKGGHPAADVPRYIFLFRKFGNVSHMRDAIELWRLGDAHIDELMNHAETLHTAIVSGTLTPERRRDLLERIESVHTRLAPIEDEFSTTLNEGARWMHRVLLQSLLAAAAALLVTGLWMSWRISRELHDGIRQLEQGALQVAAGNLDHRVEIRTRDELGRLAWQFNEMIEHRRITEHALRAHADALSRSNADLERFAVIASHDLQEPLRTVNSCTQLIAKKVAHGDADTRELSGFVTEAVHRMRQLIDGLQAYTRVQRRKDEHSAAKLEDALQTALDSLKDMIRANGAVVAYEPLPEVRANGTQISQVFQNLISNALKFNGNRPAQIHISAERLTDEWRVTVRDQGIGIEPRFAGRIFNLFQRLHTRDHYPGNGLGLAISRKIIEQHGGRIWFEPREPGVAFHFTLPAADQEMPAAA